MNAEIGEILEAFEKCLKNRERDYYAEWLASADAFLYLFLNGRLRNKYEAKDIVHTLLDKLCSGERKWNKDKYPNFAVYFFMIIKSHIWDLSVVEEKYVRTGNLYDEDDEELSSDQAIDLDSLNSISYKEVLSDKDANELIALCLEELKDDENAAIIFLYRADGLMNNEIAAELGLDIKGIEAAVKRMKRKLAPVFEGFLNIKFGRRQL